MPAEHRHQDPHDERQGDQRLGDRDQQGRVAQVERRLAEGDQEAEAEGHRGDAERQHEQPVEHRRAAGARRGCASGGSTIIATESPSSSDIQVASTAIRSEFTSARR